MPLFSRRSNKQVKEDRRKEEARIAAPRRKEDTRYGIDESRYTGVRMKAGVRGMRPEEYIDPEVRSGLIKNAQIKKTAEEQRAVKESREKEEPIATRKTRKAASGRIGRLSLLSMLGQEENRYGGL